MENTGCRSNGVVCFGIAVKRYFYGRSERPAIFMEIKFDVPSEFADVLTYIYYTENVSGEAYESLLQPGLQTILVFCFNGSFRMMTEEGAEFITNECVLLGPIKRAFRYEIPAGGQMLVLNFRDGGFYQLFGVESMSGLGEELNGLNTVEERVECVLDFCRAHLAARSAIADRLVEAWERNESVVKSVAADVGMSERAVQMLHKRIFGFTAKEKERYDRWLRAVRMVQGRSVEEVDWMDVVVEAGYYDQSQLIHDFQYYMGLSPRKYLAFQAGICVAGREL
jgi:AraC-like DNA-binding protein